MSLLNSILQCSLHTTLVISGFRSLYTIEALGIDAYCSQRMRVGLQFNRGTEMRERFLTRMEGLLSSKDDEEIFTEDLKTVLSLAEDDNREIDIISKMIQK